MLANVVSIFRARDLLWAWTGRNIRARYQQSVLGWLWAILQPAAQVAIISIVFTRFVPVDTGDIPYPVFSYVAVVPWVFLTAALTEMADSMVANMGLITKIYFPREVLPIASMLARLLDFGIAAGLLIVLLLIYRVPFYPLGWPFLPVVLAVQIALVLGLGFACAALNVLFRDVRSLLVLGLQLWFYASPIIYPVTMVPENWRWLYYLNPMAGVIEAYRDILLRGQLPGIYLLISGVVALCIFVVGYGYFKRIEFQFADVV